MPKRSLFTSITPLPLGLSREAAVAFLHDHIQMIDLNPLVRERHRIPPPPHSPEEELGCAWYSLTDKLASGHMTITYTCAFHDLARGLQTHCYAPMGVETRSKWSIGGSVPGEPSEPAELGLGAPPSGLYVREDVDLRCGIIMASFVKKTIRKSHAVLADRLSRAARNLDLDLARTDGHGHHPYGPCPHHLHHQNHHATMAARASMASSSHVRTASIPQNHRFSNRSSFADRPLPPTPPMELEDKPPLARFPSAAELQ
ncbi:hypothetical protein C2857_006772 [Epichloe festucae Fl1]|uniref:DUF7053 domain-containing protein n=1 Tax=Epichloe festucae (strain Fl1) TaxID=877507 RepID=A0A7S9KLT6_EPIFF|nr:hypothetical protein C2857_006772 [Epichloe festucae Fl1]